MVLNALSVAQGLRSPTGDRVILSIFVNFNDRLLLDTWQQLLSWKRLFYALFDFSKRKYLFSLVIGVCLISHVK